MRQKRAALSLIILLTLHVSSAGAAESPGGPAEGSRASSGEAFPERDRDVPVLREYRATVPWISHLAVREERGDILAMGAGGAIVAFAGEPRETRFPRLVTADILTALVQEGGGERPQALFLATADGIVRQFEWGKDAPKRTFPADTLWADATIRSIALSPDGMLLAVTGDSMKVRLYETESGKEIRPFLGAGAPLKGLCFSADGRRVICGDSAGKLHAFDARDPDRTTALAPHEKAVTGVAAGAGDIVYSASLDGTVGATSPSTGQRVEAVRPSGGPIDFFAVASTRQGEVRILAAGMDGAVALLCAPDMKVLARAPTVEPGVTAAAMDPAGRFMAVAYRDGTVRQWLVSKLLRGDKPPRDYSLPLPIDLADYEREEARVGMKLEPAEEGGFRVLGYLLGAWRNVHEGPAPGDIITHARGAEGWVALKDLARDLPRTIQVQEPLVVRFVSREKRRTREGEVGLYYNGDMLLRDVRALLEGDAGYDIGVEYLWCGYVHRVDPEGAAAAAGVAAGLHLELRDMKTMQAYEPAQRDIAQGKPIAARIRKGSEDSKALTITPRKRSESYRLARLSVLYHRIGCVAKANELRDEALAGAPDDHRVYLALFEANRLGDETVALLEKGIERARHKEPLVETLARYLQRTHRADEAVALLDRWAARGPLDHKLTILRGNALAWKADKSVLEEILPAVKAAADQDDPEAYGTMNAILSRLGRHDEGKSYLEREREAKRFAPPEGYPERPSL